MMPSMPDKRKQSNSMSGNSPHAKRSRSYAEDDNADDMTTPSVTPYERPRNNPFYGQKSAFPGLGTGEDELFYGPAEDGLEYLRMVRSEANTLPFVFTASKTEERVDSTTQATKEEEIYEEYQPPEVESKGSYVDGVYVAPVSNVKTVVQPATKPDDEYSDAHLSYHNLLHHRFLLLRSILKCSPPSSAIAVLDDSHPISLPRHSKNAHKEWRRLLLSVDPQTVQLACMDMESVLGVLGIMGRLMSENLRSGDGERVRRIGAWAWGLLGKCREVGQLSTEEVAEIRDLGKRAIRILHRMREDEKAKSTADEELSRSESDAENQEDGAQAELVDNENGDEASADVPDHDMQDAGTDDSVELEQAKARLRAKLGTSEEPLLDEVEMPESTAEDSAVDVALQTHALLDMIITVVGEYFGQRDLLTAREIWNESEV